MLEDRRLLAGFVMAALFSVAVTNVATMPEKNRIEGDEASHLMMAMSLVYDGDLKNTAQDVERFIAETPFKSGPEGLFLKLAPDGRYYFAKPFLFALVCAPSVALFGWKGPLYTNCVVLLLLAIVFVVTLSRTLTPTAAALLAFAFVWFSPFYSYTFTIHPDLFYALLLAGALTLTTRALASPAWSGWYFAAGLGFGLAVYEKLPFFGFLVVALVLVARGLRLPRAAGFLGLAVLSLGLCCMVHLGQDGQLLAYRGDRARYDSSTGFPPRDTVTDRASLSGDTSFAFALTQLPINLKTLPGQLIEGLIGRQTGLLGYFPFAFPLFVLSILTAWRRPQLLWHAAFAAYVLFYALLLPQNTYGGSTSLGSRYLLQVLVYLPFTTGDVLLGRRGRAVLMVAVALALLVGSLFISLFAREPFQAVWMSSIHAFHPPWNLLPLEKGQLAAIAQHTQDRMLLDSKPGGTAFLYTGLHLTTDSETKALASGEHQLLFVDQEERQSLELDCSSVDNTVLRWVSAAQTGRAVLWKGLATRVVVPLFRPVRRQVAKGQRQVVYQFDLMTETATEFVCSFSRARHLHHVGDVIDFGKPEEAEHLGLGWSHTEPAGVWAMHPSSGLAVELDDALGPNRAVAFDVEFSAYPCLVGQEVELHTNLSGVAPSSIRVKDVNPIWQTIIWEGTPEGSKTLALQFRLPKVCSPFELGHSPDRRSLGVFLRRAQLRRVR